MEMSISRKALNVAAIFDYITGAFEMVLCFMVMAAGCMALNNTELEETIPDSMGAEAVIAIGAVLGITAILSIITGYLSRRAVKDPTKIMPVWVLSIVSLVFDAANVIINFANNVPVQEMSGNIIGLVLAGIIFYIANNVKKEAFN